MIRPLLVATCSILLFLGSCNKNSDGNYHCIANVDMNDLAFIDPVVEGKKIIFVGESPHGEKPIYQNMVPFITYLHKHHGLRVVAIEASYGIYPVLESMSRGEKVDIPINNPIIEGVAAYNATLPEHERILVTSVDVESFITYNQASTVRFIKYLAGYSQSDAVRKELSTIADKLPGLETRKELHVFIDDIDVCYRKHVNTFDTIEQEEMEFVIPMLHASVEWLYDTELQKKDTKKWAEIRGEYYRQGITRALAKAEKRQGTLLCFVGSNHAVKTPAQGKDFPCGTWQEAEYFDRKFEPTKGKIASFLFAKMYEPETKKLLEDECPEFPGKGIHYLEIAKMNRAPLSLKTPFGPKYDAIFVFYLKYQLYTGPIGDAYGSRIGFWLVPENEPDEQAAKRIKQYAEQLHKKSKFVIADGALRLITDVKDVSKFKGAKTLIVAGSINANPWLKVHLEKLPFKVEADRITVDDSVYTGTDLMIKACWRSPEQVTLPVIIYSGYTTEAVAQLIECENQLQNKDLAYDYVVVKDGKIVGKGMYKEWKFWEPANKEG